MIWRGIGWVEFSKIFRFSSYVNGTKDNPVLEEIKTGPLLDRAPR